jgi:hypothetical protein
LIVMFNHSQHRATVWAVIQDRPINARQSREGLAPRGEMDIKTCTTRREVAQHFGIEFSRKLLRVFSLFP